VDGAAVIATVERGGWCMGMLCGVCAGACVDVVVWDLSWGGRLMLCGVHGRLRALGSGSCPALAALNG
jgi:hypothetical protein